MTSIGSNVASTSEGPPACAWVSLTLEEQVTNFARTFWKHHREDIFGSTFFESCARIVEELRIDPWVDLESLLHHPQSSLDSLYGTTPLHWVVLMDDITMVRYILTSGRVDINATTRYQEATALHYAVIGGNLDIVDDLLKHKVDVCIAKNAKGYSPILEEVAQGHTEVVKELLQSKEKIKLMEECNDQTAIQIAFDNGHEHIKRSLEVVKRLLQHNADVNALDEDGSSPLLCAAKEGAMNIVKLLVEHNANVNALDKNGSTPLHYAVQREGFEEVVICLLQHNADVIGLDKDGCTPLYHATRNGAMNILKLLVEHNTYVNALDKDRCSLLLWSLRNGEVDISNGLIAIGVDVQFKDNKDNNALHLVIDGYVENHNMIKVVKLLQEHGVDANAKNKKGYSPFFIAVAQGHTEVVKELLQSKAKIKLMEECNGQTAIQIAFDNGDEHIKRVLLECDDVSRYVGDLYRDRQVYVDAANAILVGAALIASVTFASWLQPPLGYTTSYLDLVPSSSNINYVVFNTMYPCGHFGYSIPFHFTSPLERWCLALEVYCQGSKCLSKTLW